MALTFSLTHSGGGRNIYLRKGLKISHARITIGATTDYNATTGFPIATNATALGLRSVWGVIAATVTDAAGTTVRVLHPFYNFRAGGLIFVEADGTAAEQADFTAGDILDMLLIGTG